MFLKAAGAVVKISSSLKVTNPNQVKLAQIRETHCIINDTYNNKILFQVPYGCLVPKNVDNLLVAGRCVSGDRVSHAAMRNMMACTVSGQVGIHEWKIIYGSLMFFNNFKEKLQKKQFLSAIVDKI